MPISLPYTLLNGTTADATQVMSDLTTLRDAVNGAVAVGTLAARPATPTYTTSLYFATDDWGGTLYTAKADLSGWSTVSSKNEKALSFTGQTSLTFTGLDGNADIMYAVFLSLDVGGTTSFAPVALRPNNDTVTTNYNFGTSAANDQGPNGLDLTARYSGNGYAAPFRLDAEGTLGARTGAQRQYRGHTMMNTGYQHHRVNANWLNTSANITSLVVWSNSALTGTAILRRLVTPA